MKESDRNLIAPREGPISVSVFVNCQQESWEGCRFSWLRTYRWQSVLYCLLVNEQTRFFHRILKL